MYRIVFNILLSFSSIYIAYIFIFASLDKIVNPANFAKDISNYEITPYWMNNLVALTLPWIELICGILIVVGLFLFIYKKSNFIDIPNNIIILMLLWFVFILSIAVYKGLDIDCGCGISEDKTTPMQRLIEDIYLLLITFFIKFRIKILSFFE
ncbi:MAG: MauE/DoxX family redox-associated membrane protein [Candidatus Neomarinimicrobiota bacterium]|tara:strand:+ start:8524 stop:8982 length:459 start_codon:yes stop_codon:yes gene_type:complete